MQTAYIKTLQYLCDVKPTSMKEILQFFQTLNLARPLQIKILNYLLNADLIAYRGEDIIMRLPV